MMFYFCLHADILGKYAQLGRSAEPEPVPICRGDISFLASPSFPRNQEHARHMTFYWLIPVLFQVLIFIFILFIYFISTRE